MRARINNLIKDKVKDFGLSQKAIEDLVSIIIDGLDDTATEETINSKIDGIVPFAKAMQAEKTRTIQTVKIDNNGGEGGEKEPTWFVNWKAKQDAIVAELRTQLEGYEVAEKKAKRQAEIEAAAKKYNVNSVLMERFQIADDEDPDVAISEYKQKLVIAGLAKADEAPKASEIDAKLQADAEAWASSL